MSGSNGAPKYELIISNQQAQQIYALHTEAFDKGLGEQFIEAFESSANSFKQIR